MTKQYEYYIRKHEGTPDTEPPLKERISTSNPIMYLREMHRGWDVAVMEHGAIAFDPKPGPTRYVELVAVDPDTPRATIGFTPGPWTVDLSGFGAIRADGMAILNAGMTPAGAVENEANLIAAGAVPELVAACEAFVEAWEKSLQLEKTNVALRLAKGAIQKARGTAGQGPD